MWADIDDSDREVEIEGCGQECPGDQKRYTRCGMDVGDELDECADGVMNGECMDCMEVEVDPEELRKARAEELTYFRNIELYDEMPTKE